MLIGVKYRYDSKVTKLLLCQDKSFFFKTGGEAPKNCSEAAIDGWEGLFKQFSKLSNPPSVHISEFLDLNIDQSIPFLTQNLHFGGFLFMFIPLDRL